MHSLLARQLRKAFQGQAPDSPELSRLVQAVDDAYRAADYDREQLERSLHLASEELYERNRRLERELEERKRLEVELQHAEKLRAVGQLAAGVAHEINTPVQFIGNSLSFLRDAFDEIERLLAAIDISAITQRDPAIARLVDDIDLPYLRVEIPRAVERCHGGCERVTKIVRALKQFSYPDATDQGTADLHAAIESTLIVASNELKYVADVELVLEAAPAARCHLGEIQQVLLNLLVNAAHAIAERVGTSGARGLIRVSTRNDGSDFVLAISDDGNGIPAEVRKRIFEPFFTTKAVGKGTGQGLSLSRAIIVDRHGGQIGFESAPGGTTFTIRIPVRGRPIARESAA